MGKNKPKYVLLILFSSILVFSAVGTVAGFVDSDDLTVDAGENVTVEYTIVANTGDEVVLEIKEYPEGWSINNNKTDGSAWNPDKEKFVWLSVREGSQGSQALRPAVDISVPRNAVSGTHEFVAELTVDNGENEETETDSTEITVENGTVGTDDLSGIAPTVTVGAGETATVDYTLETEKGEQVVLSIEEYPEGWTVQPDNSDGGAWSSEDESFVWLESDGRIKTPSVEISVPEDGVLGSHEFIAQLTVEGESGDGGNGEVTKHLTAVNVEEKDTGDGDEEVEQDPDAEPEENTESDGDGNEDAESEKEGLPGFGVSGFILAMLLALGTGRGE